MSTTVPPSPWRQVTAEFTDYTLAEHIAATQLQPLMDTATEAWWFIRKAPHWRLRYLPSATSAVDPIHQGLDTIKASGGISSWIETIYEAEEHAFGGPEAMHTAHQLFCHDSHEILAQQAHPQSHRREHTILLNSAFLRAAGQDWYEQGDVWARVAANRPTNSPSPTPRMQDLTTGLRRLMSVDIGPDSTLTTPAGQLAGVVTWVNGFHTAGMALNDLNVHGHLDRGLRAVLAHHVLFHWNRLGLPYDTQSTLAHAARQAVFDEP